jgi:hypothetical protein
MAKSENKEIIVSPAENYELTSPAQMTAMANVLKTHIVNHKLYSPIGGRNYVQVEGWQYAGGLLGLFPRIVDVTCLTQGKVYKWKAEAEIVNIKTGTVVGRGIAICSNEENKKKNFDEYAILSMAQTRAIGKAYRNLIGWVMKLAGYEGTPSEEMVKMGQKEPSPVEVVPATIAPKPGQVIGPDGQPTFLCKGCTAPITDQVAAYSEKLFKKRLCGECQQEQKKK